VTTSRPAPEEWQRAPANQHTDREHPKLDCERSTVIAALRQHYRRAKAIRELKRLIRSAPTATIRNDLMTIAARNERST